MAQGEDPPLQDHLAPGLGEHRQVESSLLELWLFQHSVHAPQPAASGLTQCPAQTSTLCITDAEH